MSAQYDPLAQTAEGAGFVFCGTGIFDCATMDVSPTKPQASSKANFIRTMVLLRLSGGEQGRTERLILIPASAVGELIHAVKPAGITTAELDSVDTCCLAAIPGQSQRVSQCSLVRIHQEPRVLLMDILPHVDVILRAREIYASARQDGEAGSIGDEVRFNFIVINHHGVSGFHVGAEVLTNFSNPRQMSQPGRE